MVSATLIEKLEQLSPELQKKIEEEVDGLLNLNKGSNDGTLLQEPNISKGYGSMKGKIFMSDDFDAPLEDFKDYL